MAEAKDSCVQPAKGPIGLAESKTSQTTEIQKEGLKMNAKVGKRLKERVAHMISTILNSK